MRWNNHHPSAPSLSADDCTLGVSAATASKTLRGRHCGGRKTERMYAYFGLQDAAGAQRHKGWALEYT